MANGTIYGITTMSDPRVRYIGFTSIGIDGRMQQHYKKAPRTPFYSWLREHRDEVEVVVLDEGDSALEAEWIRKARSAGADLFNSYVGAMGTTGSQHHPPLTDEQRVHLSEVNRGRRHSAETRARMSRSRMGNPPNRGQHVRWHENRGIVKPTCSYCMEEGESHG